ncbi:hypothetical protein GCM10010282_50560 [Streptomyces roseolus]|nr:hypothetical protein GCM10010282_50560 [Streptomyces roseolus]
MRVLFCGGPADGQWRDVQPVRAGGAVVETEVVAPPTPLEFANGTGTLTKVRYRIWPIILLGHHMYVAAPRRGAQRVRLRPVRGSAPRRRGPPAGADRLRRFLPIILRRQIAERGTPRPRLRDAVRREPTD